MKSHNNMKCHFKIMLDNWYILGYGMFGQHNNSNMVPLPHIKNKCLSMLLSSELQAPTKEVDCTGWVQFCRVCVTLLYT